jgi:uncharacterized protein (UPF0216 family)
VERRGTTTSSHGDGENIYLVVHTTETSRYVCHREDLDQIAPMVLDPASARRTKLGKPIKVTTTVSENSVLTVGGTIKVKGHKLALKATKTAARGGVPATVRLELGKLRRKLRELGATKGRAVLHITAQDAAGNNSPTQTAKVKLT